MRFDNENTLLPAKAITPELLTAYAMSQKQDHSQCTPERCVHEDEVHDLAKVLTKAVNGSPEFQAFCQKFIVGTLHHGMTHGIERAMPALATFFIYVGWELAQFSLSAEGMNKEFGVM